jgi:hypothetical protein
MSDAVIPEICMAQGADFIKPTIDVLKVKVAVLGNMPW